MFEGIRIGLAGASHKTIARSIEVRGTCNIANGDLYKSPNSSTPTIDGTKPITFTWNTDCTMSDQVSLALYAPTGFAHGWNGVKFSDGTFSAQLQPKWWNSTENVNLQLSIYNSADPSWAAVPGPVFKVNYPASAMFSTTAVGGSIVTATAAAAATQSADAKFDNVASTKSGGGISKGGIAAAVIVPILALLIIAGVAVKFWRSREAEKRRRWSQAMSSHSNLEWEKGAKPGEKPASILGRPSMTMSTYAGPGRAASMATSSIYATENMAGAGALGTARPTYSQSADNLASTARGSLVVPDPSVRQSRISFAETARPDRRSRLSLAGADPRANVTSGVWKMPFGSRSATELVTPQKGKHTAYAAGSAIAYDDEEINISPSQLQGPQAFADAEMRRAGAGKRTGRKSILSIGGSRRDSAVSHLSAEDFKSAASARGSVDELRDMEAVMLMRRSILSQHSASKSLPDLAPPVPSVAPAPAPAMTPNMDTDAAEHLAPDAEGYFPAPSPALSTVAYGPDQMLAVYAARAKSSAPAPSPPIAAGSQGKKQGIRILTGLTGKKDDAPTTPTGEMRSLTHLHNGTASAAAVEALPAPGPKGLRVPVPPVNGRARSNTATMHSEVSAYSEDNDAGHAQ